MKMKSSPAFKTLSAFLAFASLLMWTQPISAADLPSGYRRVSGDSNYVISPDGRIGTLTANDGVTIGEWSDGFNIGNGFTFNALLPENGVHLSRDITTNPSEIFGALNVPRGRFFLVNQNGIFFAPGSQVNAAGLVASSLNISNEDFIKGCQNGTFQFAGDNPGAVINAGTMNIGANGVALLGGAVENRGVIMAQESSVAMAAGKEMTLSFDPSGKINVLVTKEVAAAVKDISKQDGTMMKDAVSNSGFIKADGGRVLMTAEAANNIFDSLVNQRGIVEANSVGTKTGEIVLSSVKSNGLVVNSGTLNAKGDDVGEKGGKVTIEGQKVGVTGDGVVDASGYSGGGTIRIGGDYHGVGTIRNSDLTYIAPNARISADAILEGDGGNVVVWSDKDTIYAGTITARGGALEGDGGFVEVSGKDGLTFLGDVDLSAANGSLGTLLLDPSSVTIYDIATTGSGGGGLYGLNGNLLADNEILAGDANAAGSKNNITWGAIDSLAATANVVIEATGLITINDITGAAGGSITAPDLVMLDLTSGSLTIRSTAGSVQFNDTNDTIRTEGGAISFYALGGSLTLGSLNTTGASGTTQGNVTLQATNGISVGDVTTRGGDFSANADFNTDGAGTFTVNTGKIIDTTNAGVDGTIDITAADAALDGSLNSGVSNTSIKATNGRAIGLGATAGDMTISGTELQRITAGNLILGDATNGNITVDGITAAQSANIGTVTLNATKATSKVNFSNTNSQFKALTANAGAGIDVNAALKTTDGALNLATATGNVVLNNNLTTVGQDVNLTGDVVLAGNIAVDTTNAGLATGGSITFNDKVDGTVAGNQNLTLTAGTTGDVTFADAVGSNVRVGDLTVQSANNVSAQAVTAKSIAQNAGVGTTTLNGAVNTNGAAGINLIGNNFDVKNTVTTTSGGGVTVNNSGTLNIDAAGDMSLDGAFNQTGVGSVTTAGDITTTNDNISFNGPVTTSGAVALNTGAGAGDITFANVLGGAASDVTLSAGTGKVDLQDAVNLNSLTVSSSSEARFGGNVTTVDNQNITGSVIKTNAKHEATGAGNVLLNGNVQLENNTILKTNSGNITTVGTVDGAKSLTVQSTSGNADLQQNVGSATPLASLDVNTAAGTTRFGGNVTTTGNQNITATTVNTNGALTTQTAGSAIDINGDLNLQSNSSLNTNNGDITVTGKTTGATKTLGVTAGSGTADLQDDVSVQALTVNSAGVARFGANVTTSGSQDVTAGTIQTNATHQVTGAGEIDFKGNVQLQNDTSLETAGGDITVTGAVDGAHALDADAGTGNIDFQGPIGGSVALTSLLATAMNIALKSVKTTGAQTYNGDVALDGVLKSTTAGAITVNGDTTLLGDTTVETAGLAGTDDIVFNGKIDGAKNLVLKSGLGDILIGGITGGTLSLLSFIAQGASIGVKAVTTTGIQRFTGATTLDGDLRATDAGSSIDVIGALTLASDSDLSTNSGNITVTGAVSGAHALGVSAGIGDVDFQSALNIGSLDLTDAGSARFGSNVTTSGAQTVHATNIYTNGIHSTTAGDILLDGAVTLQNNTTLDTSTGGNNVTVTGTVNGAKTLSVNGGVGSVNFQNHIGDTTALAGLTVSNAGNARFGGNVTTTGNQSVTASAIQTNGTHTATTAGASITLNGPVTLQNDTSLVTNNGDITTGTIDGAKTLSVNAGTVGDVVLGAIGASTALSALTVIGRNIGLSSVRTSGGQTYTVSTGEISLSGDLTSTSGGNIILNGLARLADTVSDLVTITTNGGNVLFNGKVSGTTAATQSLTVNSGVGSITFADSIGDPVKLKTLTLNSLSGLITLPAVVNVAEFIFAGLYTLTGNTTINLGTGTIGLNSVNAGAYDLTLIADEINFLGGANSITGTGSLVLQPFTVGLKLAIAGLADALGQMDITTTDLTAIKDGFTKIVFGRADGTGGIDINAWTFTDPVQFLSPAGGAINVLGTIMGLGNASILIDGSGATTNLSANIITAGNSITILDSVRLLADILLDTTNGGAVTSGADVTISGTVDSDVATNKNLDIQAGTAGNVDLQAALGSNDALGILTIWNALTARFGGNVTTTGNQDITAATIRTNGTHDTMAGSGQINLTGNVELQGNTALNTNGQNVTVTGTVNGAKTLSVAAGSGDVEFQSAMGNTTALSSLTVVSANIARFLANVTTSGNQSLTASGSIRTNGIHQVTGAGNTIAINGNLRLQNDTTLQTNNGDITVTGNVNNASALTVIAGTGTALFQSAIGNSTALSALTIMSAGVARFLANVTTNGSQNITASSIRTNGTHTTNNAGAAINLNGNVTLQNATNLNTNNGNITVTGTVDGNRNLGVSAGSGSVDFQGNVGSNTAVRQLTVNAGTARFGGDVTTNNAQTITAGTIRTNGAHTVNNAAQAISLNGNVELQNNTTLQTAGGDITLNGTVDGAKNLILNAGAGNILMAGAVGAATRLAQLIVQNANDWTANGNIFANSITQNAGTGTTTFHGNLDTNGAGGIQLTGTNFVIGDNASDWVTTTNGGPFYVTNSGTYTLNSSLNLSGAFGQYGTGAFNLNTDITTNNFNIEFAGAVTLGGNRILNAGTASIVFLGTSSLNAQAFDVTMTADEIDLLGGADSIYGTGNIVLQPYTASKAINLAGVAATTGLDLTAADLTALKNGFNSITIGRTDGNGAVNLVNTFTFYDPLTIRTPNAGGSIAINGDLIGADNASITLLGSGATTTLNADIITLGNFIYIDDKVILGNSVVLDTTNGGGVVAGNNIQITGKVDATNIGVQGLELNAGTTGNVQLDGAVGSDTRLGDLKFERANDVDATDIFAKSVSTGVTGITGTATFNGKLNTNGAAGIDLNGNNFNFNDTVTATNTGGMKLTNTGNTELLGAVILDGAFTQDGAGTVYSSNNITTNANDISFAAPVVLRQNVQFSTGLGIGDILFGNTVDSDAPGTPRNLTLVAGAGNIVMTSAMGGTNALNAFVISSANDVTAAAPINATSLTQSAGTGTSTFDAINTTGATGIVLDGVNFTLNGPVTTTGSGGLHVTNSGTLAVKNDVTLDGAFIQDGLGVTELGDPTTRTISTTGDLISFLGPVKLAGDMLLNSAGGNINFSDSINGTSSGAQNLTLAAGVGNIVFAGAIGLAVGQRLGDILIQNAGNVTSHGDIKASSFSQAAGSGTTQFNGFVDLDGATGLDLTGTNFEFKNYVVTSNGGDVLVNHTGSLVILPGADMFVNGNFIENGGGDVVTGGDIVTDGGNIRFHDVVSLIGDVLFNSNGGNIRFYDNVNASTAGVEGMTLASGTGNIIMDKAIGSATRLGALIFKNANNITTKAIHAQSIQQLSGTGTTTFNGNLNTNSGGIDLDGHDFVLNGNVNSTGDFTIQDAHDVTTQNINAASIRQVAGSGTTTFNGNLNTNSAQGVDLTGTDFVLNGDVTTTGNGGFDMTNSGLFQFNGNFDLDGAFMQDGTGLNDGQGSIQTTGYTVTFTTGLTLTGDLSFDTTGAGLLPAGADLNFIDTVDGPYNVTIQTGMGSTDFRGDVGSNVAVGDGVGLAINNLSLGDTTFHETLQTNSGIHVDNDITFKGDVNLGDGAVGTTLDGNVTLEGVNFSGNDGIAFGNSSSDQIRLTTGAVSIDSNDSALDFNGTVDGNQNLTVNSGTADTNFNAAVGSLQAVGSGTGAAITINTATGGTTNFNSTVQANSGIDAADGSNVVFNGNVTLGNGDTGTTLSGDVTLNGVTFSGHDGIAFGDALSDQLTLAGVAVNVNSNNSDLNFNGLVDGNTTLTTNSGSGNTRFWNDVGSTVPLASLIVAGAAAAQFDGNVTTVGNQSVTAGTILTSATHTAGGLGSSILFDGNVQLLNDTDLNTNDGAVTVTGTIDGNSKLGVSAGAGAVDLQGNIGSTTALDTLTVNAGSARFGGNVKTVNDQNVTAATIMTNGAHVVTALGQVVNFIGDLVLQNNTSFTTNDGDITLNGMVDGAHDLTLNSGAGDISVTGDIGSTTRIGALIIQNAHNVDFGTLLGPANIFAASIRQLAATAGGTTFFHGDIDTNGAAGIELNGVNFTIGNGPAHTHTVTTTNGGDFDATHTGTLTLNSDMTLSGAFIDHGTGPTILNGNITTAGGAIDFYSDVLLTALLTMLTSAGGNITFHGLLDGQVASGNALTIDAGNTGDVLFSGDIGSGATAGSAVRLGALTITNAHDVTAAGTVTVDSVIQNAGTGTTTFANTVDTTNAGTGVGLTGNDFVFQNSVNVQNGGDMTVVGNGISFSNAPVLLSGGGNLTLTNSGALNIDTNSDFTILGGGYFLQNGNGTAFTGSDVITEGGTITWDDPTLLADVLMDTTNGGLTPAGADITFNDHIDGAYNLTLRGGTSGNIALNGPIGQITRLNDLIIDNGHDVLIAAATNVAHLIQNAFAGYGTTTINGAVNTNGAGTSVDLNGNNFTINNTITTTGGGVVEITNGGLLDITAAGDMNLDGSFTQNGAGLVSTAGDIVTTNDDISFASDVTLTGDVLMDTGAGAGTITFSGLLDSDAPGTPRNLTLSSGTGDILFNDVVGSTNLLGAVLINSVNNLTANENVDALSFTQMAGTGLSWFKKNLTTYVSQGVDLTGNQFQFDGDVVANNGKINVDGTGSVLVGDAAADRMQADQSISIRGDLITLNSTLESDADLSGSEGITVLANRTALSTIMANNTITSHGGDILLEANDGATFAVAADISSNDGNITVTADKDGDQIGALTMNDGTLFDAGSGRIALSAGQDVILGGLKTTNATTNAVSVTSTNGAILDGGDTYLEVDAKNGTATFSAKNGIGTTLLPGVADAALDLDVSALTATTTQNDINLDLESTGPTTVNNAAVTGGAGNITIQQLGDFALTVINSSTVNGFINLSSISDLIITGRVNAQGVNGSVTLTADAAPGHNSLGDVIIRQGAEVLSSGAAILTGQNVLIFGHVIAQGVATVTSAYNVVLGLLEAQKFSIVAGNNIQGAAQNDATNLIGSETSTLEAGGVIGWYYEPLRFLIRSGDLEVIAHQQFEQVSVALQGFATGEVVAKNLMPGLMMVNLLGKAGEPMPAYDSAHAAAFNLIGLDRPLTGMGDRDTTRGLLRGLGLIPGFEKPKVPVVERGIFESAAPVLVNEKGARLWSRVIRPVPVAPKPVVALPVPPKPVVAAPVPPAPKPVVVPPAPKPVVAAPVPVAKPQPLVAQPKPIVIQAAGQPAPSTPAPRPGFLRRFFAKPQAQPPTLTPPVMGPRLFQRSVEETPVPKEPWWQRAKDWMQDQQVRLSQQFTAPKAKLMKGEIEEAPIKSDK